MKVRSLRYAYFSEFAALCRRENNNLVPQCKLAKIFNIWKPILNFGTENLALHIILCSNNYSPLNG